MGSLQLDFCRTVGSSCSPAWLAACKKWSARVELLSIQRQLWVIRVRAGGWYGWSLCSSRLASDWRPAAACGRLFFFLLLHAWINHGLGLACSGLQGAVFQVKDSWGGAEQKVTELKKQTQYFLPLTFLRVFPENNSRMIWVLRTWFYAHKILQEYNIHTDTYLYLCLCLISNI